jgi:hypothetical protein
MSLFSGLSLHSTGVRGLANGRKCCTNLIAYKTCIADQCTHIARVFGFSLGLVGSTTTQGTLKSKVHFALENVPQLDEHSV